MHCEERQSTSVLTTATLWAWEVQWKRGTLVSTMVGSTLDHMQVLHACTHATLGMWCIESCPSQPAAVQSATHAPPQPAALCRGHRPCGGGQMRHLSPFKCHHHDIAGYTSPVYTHLVTNSTYFHLDPKSPDITKVSFPTPANIPHPPHPQGVGRHCLTLQTMHPSPS